MGKRTSRNSWVDVTDASLRLVKKKKKFNMKKRYVFRTILEISIRIVRI